MIYFNDFKPIETLNSTLSLGTIFFPTSRTSLLDSSTCALLARARRELGKKWCEGIGRECRCSSQKYQEDIFAREME